LYAKDLNILINNYDIKMRLLDNKKGAEMSMNVLVIAILVILVLVIVGAFFLGGVGKLFPFFNTLTPDELSVATQACANNCLIAQNLNSVNQQDNSDYCRKTWKLDTDGDGDADTVGGEIKQYRCWDGAIGESCPGVQCSVQ
jgi:uncharacterized protein (UPF0333 family)